MRTRIVTAALAAALVCIGTAATARAADPEVETSVYRSHVASGEPITLQIRVRGAAAEGPPPDLTPLERDFSVLDVHQTHRASIVNGVVDESIDYVVALAARQDGDLVIPSLQVGNTTTEPVAVQVSAGGRTGDVAERDPAAEAPADPVRIETHVDRSKPYEQERIVLRIDLYAAGEVVEGSLSAPEIPGAVVEQIGEDRQIERETDGQRYAGIERTYTVVPESSGEIVVSPIRFEGIVRVPRPRSQRRQLEDPFGGSLLEQFFGHRMRAGALLDGFFGSETRRVAVASKPFKLKVQPKPEDMAGRWWLPARAVSLSEKWDPASASVRVGEPITRRVEVRADGVSPAQIPALPGTDVEGVKAYAEVPKVTETLRGTVRVDETTLIPTQPGSVTLPAVEIAWFDTKSATLRTASLPERNIEVIPAAAGDEPTGAGAAPAPAPAPAVAPAPTRPAILPALGALASHLDWRGRSALAAAAALLIFSLGVLVARRRLPGRSPVAAVVEKPTPTRRSLERVLRRACARKDAVAADAAVRALRRLLGADAGIFRDPTLAAEIARLHAVRYSTQEEAWSGAALSRAWRRARKQRRPAARSEELPPLYPAP